MCRRAFGDLFSFNFAHLARAAAAILARAAAENRLRPIRAVRPDRVALPK